MRAQSIVSLLLTLVLVWGMVLILPPVAEAQGPEVIVAREFHSTGDLIEGWYWLRDDAHQQTADWVFDRLPAGSGDIELRFEVLATDQVSGGPGIDAYFFLSYGVPPTGQMGGVLYERLPIQLRNQPVPGDTNGYYCLGTVTIPRAALRNAQLLWLHVSRADELNQLPPSNVHVAFRLESIVIAAAGAAGGQALTGASNFDSNGDLVEGWYWLRDEARQHYARWQFPISAVPAGAQAITFQVNALATDTFNGGPGFPADFRVTLLDQSGNAVNTQIVQIANTSPRGDPLGYTCQGTFTLPWPSLTGETFYILITRDPQMNNHVAFNRDSLQLLVTGGGTTGTTGGTGTAGETGTTGTTGGTGTTGLADADFREQAVLIQAGTYTADLGQTLSSGQRDNEDWYALSVQAGQIVTIRLIMPTNASFSLAFYAPGQSSSSGSATSEGQARVLRYAVSLTGTWYIRVARSSGEGSYQLIISVENQNDAGSGRDAGNERLAGLPVSPGTFSGYLLDDDDEDWYAVNVSAGQIVTAQLTAEQGLGARLSLRDPSGSAQGNVQTSGNTQSVSFAAHGTGLWYVRIARERSQGTYTVALSVQDQNDGGAGHDAGSSPDSAVPIGAGAYSGYLQDNDDVDWYAFSVTAGQTISVQLSMPPDSSLLLALKNPVGETKGDVQRDGMTRLVTFTADATGLWYVRVEREHGQGTYQLAVGLSG